MTALIVVLSLIGSFALARWYGMVAALGAVGVNFAVHAWLPQFSLTVGPVLLLGVGALILLGRQRGRSA